MSASREAGTARALLTVEALDVSFAAGRERVHAVRGVGFEIRPGECLAIVGESGSGKSVTARALMGLAGQGSSITAKRLELDGEDLTRIGDRRWRELRGGKVGMVLQDALSSLDPLRTVGAEITETLRNHRTVPRGEHRERAVALLEQVRVPDPRLRARQYPHQLSGGQRQRALIASAMAADPPLLIADEPTTALDVTVQARILDLLSAMKDAGTAVLLISHDLSVVARLADRIAVMHEGVFVEQGTAGQVLRSPSAPYTRRLLAAVPSGRARPARGPAPRHGGTAPASGHDSPPEEILTVDGVSKSYPSPDGTRRPAVDGVSLTLHRGEILGVVGESGSGKSTLAGLVLGLQDPDAGAVTFLGTPWSRVPEPRRRPLRGRIQFVHQDPLASFDPRYTVERVVAEALGAPGRRAVRRRRDEIAELLHRVGLDASLLGRHPRRLSGGQRQRVAIARALAPRPEVIVCDEPVSALDVSVQAQVLDLFADLRASLGVSLLFISHDLGVIHHLSDRVIVMREGRIVESGPVDEVFHRPAHPYTQDLLAALPQPTTTSDAAPA